MKPIHSLLAAVALASGILAFQDEGNGKAEMSADQATIAAQLPSYPLDTCVVSEEPLDAMGEPIDVLYEGRLVRLCCKGCKKQLKKDPASVLAKIDAAVVAAQGPSYPLEKCVVSGKPLGEMGEPVDFVHGTRLVRFCCKGCVKPFQKEPGKYMAMVDEALIRAQRASYPLKTCVVSGLELSEPHDVLYGTRLVRFCCEKCEGEFRKDPAKFLAKLDAAG